ncbi:MAG: extracellular solute-binding protein [Saprospiraceae bacterium]|nr:extracellular solute-binding protein [Saprospiraceae bacterium]
MKYKTLLISLLGVFLLSAFYFIIIRKDTSAYSLNGNKDSKAIIKILGEETSTILALQSIETEYEKLNPKVDLQFFPNTYDEAFNKGINDMKHKTGIYDIILQYNFSLAPFVENDYVYLLEDLKNEVPNLDYSFENDILPNFWYELGHYKLNKAASSNYLKVGYPSAALTMLLMYNKPMFEDPDNKKDYKLKFNKELNPPKTWQEFLDIAGFFSKNDTKGVCLEGSSDFLYFEIMNILGDYGGKILATNNGWESNKSTKVVFNSQENKAAFEFFQKLKGFNQGGFSNVEQVEQMKIMKEGKTAMAMVWSDMLYPALMDTISKTWDDRFGFTSLPGNSSLLGGGAYFVSKQTKNKAEVTKFINYVMQSETQIKLSLAGLCSPLKSVYSDERLKVLPYSQALNESLNRAKITLLAGRDATKLKEILVTKVQEYYKGEISLDELLSKTELEIKESRSEYLK